MDWRTSSYSANNGACVQVAAAAGVAVLVRDSQDPDGTVLALTPAAWRDLTARVKAADG
jgi:uncharacterized protein DUF397